jgi:hypothetical protein
MTPRKPLIIRAIAPPLVLSLLTLLVPFLQRRSSSLLFT